MSRTDDVLGKLRALENALANTHPLACDVVNEAANLIRSLQADAQRKDLSQYVAAAQGILDAPPNPANITLPHKSETGYSIYEAWARRCASAIVDAAALSVGQISNIDKRKLSMEEDTGQQEKGGTNVITKY